MKKINTVERDEDAIQTSIPISQNEEMIKLQKTNENLNLLFDLHNKILGEYQLKYGNELYDEIKGKFDYNLGSDYLKIKGDFIENISIIHEFTIEITNKDNIIDSLNLQIDSLNQEIERLLETEAETRSRLKKTTEEKAELLNKILNNENKNYSKTMDFPVEDKFSSTMKLNNKNETDFKNYSDLMTQQREELLSLVEKYKCENESLINMCNNLNEKLNDLQNDFNIVSKEFESYKMQNEDFQDMRDNMTQKFIRYNEEILKLESEVENLNIINEKLSSDESIFKKELQFYKDSYEDLETRKNNEIDSLIREITNNKIAITELRNNKNYLEEESSNMKFENARQKHELLNSKDDIIQLTKALEESNRIMVNVNEKEKKLDLMSKNCKKKIDEASIEKEKAITKVRLLEQQLIKSNSDYNKILNEKQEKYENFLESVQSKYTLMIENKTEEIKSLKENLMNSHCERDKYFNEYNFIKKEYDKLFNSFREENNKYMFKYETTEKKALQLEDDLNERVNELEKKLEKSENRRNILEKELKIYTDNDKNKDFIINKLSIVYFFHHILNNKN